MRISESQDQDELSYLLKLSNDVKANNFEATQNTLLRRKEDIIKRAVRLEGEEEPAAEEEAPADEEA